ncbi:MAG: DUF928 domain-containing protein [Brasilonema octagenarum HA4186-MV1]|jgi:hypothetical protein|uniref:Uncharacterized protein n=1 Tax=Brasilonema octagenarum UFV-OR1 TaxID=417115 RepID=A0ABX1M1G7_9CYAN|nr:DUF928 domain-containing protein [Brasilonema octagenarum]MBW4628495.1 DUF928 domain-containing protein [Brasilonema octagenarum HA4186-MV1]NMF61491.1 hypothetical protein [Brasilonema octagenarum UFV-OR1]
MKIIYFSQFLTIWLFVEFLLTLSLSAHAQQKFEARSGTLAKRLISQQNFIPPRQGKPKDTSGAGSRSRLICSKQDDPIQPLMLKQNHQLKFQERPTRLVSIPKTSAHQVVLMFPNKTGKSNQREFIPINTDSRFVDFTQSKQKQPLAEGKNHQCFSMVICGEIVQLDLRLNS